MFERAQILFSETDKSASEVDDEVFSFLRYVLSVRTLRSRADKLYVDSITIDSLD